MKDSVGIVDANDRMIGTMDKLAAHKAGIRHRAFSVFIFNSEGELLLQRRNPEKYHSGGLWSNTCCSHPRLGENIADAAYRRLKEEMNLSCILDFVFKFAYKAEVGAGLIENEIDHVFFGVSDEMPIPSPEEVADFTYMSLQDLKLQLNSKPEQYTAWLNICFDRILQCYQMSI